MSGAMLSAVFAVGGSVMILAGMLAVYKRSHRREGLGLGLKLVMMDRAPVSNGVVSLLTPLPGLAALLLLHTFALSLKTELCHSPKPLSLLRLLGSPAMQMPPKPLPAGLTAVTPPPRSPRLNFAFWSGSHI